MKEFPILSIQTSSNIIQPNIPVASSPGMLFLNLQKDENHVIQNKIFNNNQSAFGKVIGNGNLSPHNKIQTHLQQNSLQKENRVDLVRNVLMANQANYINNVITVNAFPCRNHLFIHLAPTTVGLLDNLSTKISLTNSIRLESMVSSRVNQITHQTRLVKPLHSAELHSYQPSRLVFKKVDVSPLKDTTVATVNHSLSMDTNDSKENVRQSNTENIVLNSMAVKDMRPDRELRQIADQVYRILEKRIMIEKDKRGWLNGR